MDDTYTACISIQQRVGDALSVSVHGTEGLGAEARMEHITFDVEQHEEPEDLRDWLRMALAAACEAL